MFIVLPKGKDIVDVHLGDPGPKSDISQFREAQDKLALPDLWLKRYTKAQNFIG